MNWKTIRRNRLADVRETLQSLGYEVEETPYVMCGFTVDSQREIYRAFVEEVGGERGCVIYVVATKEKIVRMQHPCNQYLMEEEGEEQKILPLEDILKSAISYYDDLLLTDERTIYRISFNYIPVLKELTQNDQGQYMGYYDMIPGWCLEVSHGAEGLVGYYTGSWVEVIYVNAITGELIR